MPETANPWLSSPEPEPVPYTPVSVEMPPLTGPAAPQDNVSAPERDLLPVRDRPGNAELWWVGAHGGAGESTLSALVPEWRSAGHCWPRPPIDERARAVLVARSSAYGLQAAQSAVTQWAAGAVPHVDLLGLVIIADAPGRLPRPLRELAQVVGGGAPRVWQLPWVEPWRLGELPAPAESPRAVRRLVKDLNLLIDGTDVDADGANERKEH
ncbi:Hypothetical protein ACGLYG10_2939 [Actinomyces glycerinitolerans]|uniref:Uncharacterized protein n=2 Tax=Actinomyces glycerinitolerans TaxID=1892869 RepID=A0A1M4S3A1_9ACTO|nr:Hypothetical protein ACGLYG10_2939 [Actinomyces glycerinitolerans]